jgi:PAS domain S-box-containing protein
MHDDAGHGRTVLQLEQLNALLEAKVETQGQLLAETQERLRTLFENAPLSIQLLDVSGRTLQVNAAWRALWRIPPDVVENFILRDYNILKDPQLEKHGLLPYFQRALRGENSRIPAIRYDAAEPQLAGRARWVEGNLYPVKDAAGEVRQLVLIHEDVTERREAQELILRKSAEFEAVYQHLPEPVIMTSPERIIVLVNPAANALFGYAPDELIGRPVSLLEAEGTALEHAPGAEAREVSYRHRSGELILTSTLSSVARSADGEVFGYVAIVRDIREQRREEEMHRFISNAGDVLASSLDPRETLSALARLAVPTLGDWCLIDLLEDDGSLRRAEVVIADPRDEPVRAKIARFAIRRDRPETPPARALFEARPLLIPVLEREKIGQLALNDEHAQVILEAQVHSMICVPLVARGRVLGVLSLLLAASRRSYTERDLSYAKQLAGKAAQAVENSRLYERATEAISARDEFLSICSHELKTPLTSMKLQIELACRSLQKPASTGLSAEALTTRLGVATRQLRRVERLIDDMLDVSRLATGMMTMDMAPLSVRELVTETVHQASEVFRAAGVALTVEVSDEARVHGDRARLAQVLDNLLSNALKYGEGKPVRIDVGRRGDRVELSVSDQGPGIAPRDLQRIFQRFERAVASRSITGLGLGLHISRQIAERHGGTLDVESEPGAGARFTLRLPVEVGGR